MFGTKAPVNEGCVYTAHNTDDLYYAGEDAEGNALYYHSCIYCGDAKNSKTFSVATWTPATCTDPKTCSVCGITEGEALDHDWDEGEVTTVASCTVPGVKNQK